ncbi:MAG: hypothetical protein M5T61_10380 [Acidimicrobiia bacterium]|nr:hypothetical protein [Acidimicrobiia bacterium]
MPTPTVTVDQTVGPDATIAALVVPQPTVTLTMIVQPDSLAGTLAATAPAVELAYQTGGGAGHLGHSSCRPRN